MNPKFVPNEEKQASVRVKVFSLLMFVLLSLFCIGFSAQAMSQEALVEAAAVEQSQDSAEQEQSNAGDEDSQKSAAEDKEDNPLNFDLDHVIEVNEVTSHWFGAIEKTLEKYGLDGSAAGQLIASAAATLFILFAYFILKFLLKAGIKRSKLSKFGKHVSHNRAKRYSKLLSWIFIFVVFLGYISALTIIWLENPSEFLESSVVTTFTQSFFSLIIISAIGILIFEGINAGMDLIFSRFSTSSSRIDTLMPIIRNTVLSAFFLLMGLTILSELGINVFPLLAGAGVVGFAIGFGAQTLVKDVLTGFIIIIEDLFHVGDVVRVGDRAGLVERITIRKVQLRDLSGIVYTVPFSEITIVENFTKEFSYYLMDIGVAYREDTDEVIKLLRQVDEELREDEDFSKNILEPIEILGLDQFGDSAIIIKARIKTLPIKQWEVGREFNRRMKYAFDKHNIEIPFPHQTIYFGEDKEGKSPPANLNILENKGNAKSQEANTEKANNQQSQSDPAKDASSHAPDNDTNSSENT